MIETQITDTDSEEIHYMSTHTASRDEMKLAKENWILFKKYCKLHAIAIALNYHAVTNSAVSVGVVRTCSARALNANGFVPQPANARFECETQDKGHRTPDAI
ncbi:hypothetical protein EVAR_45411_1 [Eumeta japonica]|uniref:Uncharacterized protein n=1 Tax=Eumeta variegata TaxID=151549 RepID=A0A4C1WQ64_EUMVA|nr:hypothetical protein EVAR_45411_1 [Eumeta japonica]